MERMPLSKEPVGHYLLIKMACIDSFALGVASTFFGSAISDIGPESVILGFIGLMFLYVFISDYTGKNEISVLRKNIPWFNTYSNISYASIALVGFFIPFDALEFLAFVALFPVLFNACLARPIITVKIYHKNYTSLFGVIDA